jgi:pentose-5-phosphate-3-epimerase
MSVFAGYGGQPFIEEKTYERMDELKKMMELQKGYLLAGS